MSRAKFRTYHIEVLTAFYLCFDYQKKSEFRSKARGAAFQATYLRDGDQPLFGDKEGVIVIPREAEEEVVRLALEKVRGEKLVAKAIREGMSAVDAYKTFGIM